MNVQELKTFLARKKEELPVRQLCGFQKRRHVTSNGYGYCFTRQVRFGCTGLQELPNSTYVLWHRPPAYLTGPPKPAPRKGEGEVEPNEEVC